MVIYSAKGSVLNHPSELYVSEKKELRIWKIMFLGNTLDTIVLALSPH